MDLRVESACWVVGLRVFKGWEFSGGISIEDSAALPGVSAQGPGLH